MFKYYWPWDIWLAQSVQHEILKYQYSNPDFPTDSYMLKQLLSDSVLHQKKYVLDIFYICLFTGEPCIPKETYGSEDNPRIESLLPPCELQQLNLSMRIDGKHLFPLSHLSGPVMHNF